MERVATKGRRRGLLRGRRLAVPVTPRDRPGVRRRRAGLVSRIATDRWAHAASSSVDAASEAIAYERGYEGDILEPADVNAVFRGVRGTIRRAPAAALAIASRGLTPASSLLREKAHAGPLLAAAGVGPRARARANGEDARVTPPPAGYYGL